MTQDNDRTLYVMLTALGALAGLCGWALIEAGSRGLRPDRDILGLSGVAFAGFAVLLALVGPAPLRRAVVPSLAIGGGLGMMFWLGSFRHAHVEGYLALGYPLAAYASVLLVSTPFAAAAIERRGGWRDYARLFDHSWRILIRYAGAALFVALFWALVLLSDALLQIVGLALFDVLTATDWFVAMLTGAVFGLALAVTNALSAMMAPDLLLRLLRLLAPVVLTVVAVFLVMLPVRGWDGLLAGLSPAASLIAFAFAAITLVTIALDRGPEREVSGQGMRMVTAALAVATPVLAGLALWAIALRVGQYGWTPARLIATALAGVSAAHGLAYAVIVLWRSRWPERLRQANIWLSLATVLFALSWFTPLIHPEQIAARDQLQRALQQTDASGIPLRAMAQDWGVAGARSVAALRTERPDLVAEIERTMTGRRQPIADVEDIAAQLAVYPVGRSVMPDNLEGLSIFLRQELASGCRIDVQGVPGCALYFGEFGAAETEQAILFAVDEDGDVRLWLVARNPDGQFEHIGRVATINDDAAISSVPASVLGRLREGEAVIAPSTRKSLFLGGIEFFPIN
ncbi:DUF4153 domain-containing protein [Cognatishimia sp. F0-27]|uniref:DUF4153 domain-containing protein n=1 Tax=Cognatishimia sp. F0-27 TaxID=2816855 RepID=UPI001D0BFD1D|nr:DUF4153 domain-containing protein [Cognatishimia sp. F0-27]MCC1492174.1 DUF4153 domain-containing protein [Cognatishimia sp. F0-27]